MEAGEWEFSANAYLFCTEDFWYDLTDGGYIKPELVLSNGEQIRKLNEAISILRSFETAFFKKAEEAEMEDNY